MRLELDQQQSHTIFPIDHTQTTSRQQNVEEAAKFLREGIKHAQSGNRTQARTELIKASELDPSNESVWLWLSSISEYPEELLAFLNKVLEINPENARALEWSAATKGLMARNLIQRGVDAVEGGQNGIAADLFEQALEMDPQNVQAHLFLASVTATEAEKIRHFERVLQLDPENETATAGIDSAKSAMTNNVLADAKHFALRGDLENANGLLEQLLTEQPDAEEVWVLRSHFAPDLETKVRYFRRVLEINPDNAVANANVESLFWVPLDEEAQVESTESSHDEAMLRSFSEAGDTEEADAESFDRETEAFLPDVAEQEELDEQPPPAAAAWEQSTDEGDNSFAVGEEAQYESASFQNGIEGDSDLGEISYELANEASDLEGQPDLIAEAHQLTDEVPGASAFEPAYTVEEVDESVQPVPFPSASSFPESSCDPADEYKTLVSVELDDEMRATIDSYGQQEPLEPAGHGSPFDAPFDVTMFGSQIPMPGQQLEAEIPPHTTGFETNIVTSTADDAQKMPAYSACPFCRHHNDQQAISCTNCLAVLTLADLELVLGNHNADKAVLRDAVESLERETTARELSEYELTMLGIGHLNLRNLQFGFNYLQEASHKNPNNVVLAGQVNALLIRLEEIKLQAEAHESMTRGKKILVVDDSPTVRKLIAGKLEKCGHEVFCSSDGVEAMEQIGEVQPDLVLLDITMPRMDGYQVCKMIRSSEKTKDVPVVMISGKDGFFDKVRGRMAGSSGYITKPFGPETLMKAVESYLRGEFQDS